MTKSDERKAWTDRVVKSEMAASFKTAKRSKYGAVKKIVNGRTYDSTKEANRAIELALLQAAGEISDLEFQPVYDLTVRHESYGIVTITKVSEYRADFRYWRKGPHGMEQVIEDVKSTATANNAIYKLKKKMVEAQYQITITET